MTDKQIELLPCPMCGGVKGYQLSEGSTYRWWNVTCADCGRTIDDCNSDRRMKFGEPLPEKWPDADYIWNEAGKYAEALRAQLSARQGEPVGWKLVPIETTEEMIENGCKLTAHNCTWPDDYGLQAQNIRRENIELAYKAMLAASPPSQAQAQDNEIVALKCPNCDDDGFTIEADSNSEEALKSFFKCQCEFCYTVPNSIFNLRESIEQALQQGKNNG
jgi:hypothetical protein